MTTNPSLNLSFSGPPGPVPDQTSLNAAVAQAQASRDQAVAVAGQMSTISASISDYQLQTIAPITGKYVNTAGIVASAGNRQYIHWAVTGAENGFIAHSTMLDPQALVVYKVVTGGVTSWQYEQLGTDSSLRPFPNYQLTVPAGTTDIYVNGRTDQGGGVTSLSVKLPVPDVVDRLKAVEERGSGLGSSAICAMGDSQSTDASGYDDELAAKHPDRTFYKQGISGQRIEHIAARMDALAITLLIAITIPTTGSVALPYVAGNPATFGLSTDLLRSLSGTCVIKVSIKGITCALSFDAAANSGAGGYTLTPIDYPAQAINAGAGTVVKVLTGFVTGTDPTNCPALADMLGGIVIIRAVRNNINGGLINYDINSGLDLIEAMVKKAREFTDKIIVIGQMLGWADLPSSQGGSRTDDVTSWSIYAAVVAWNKALAARFSTFWFDVHAYHVAHGGAEQKTINPNGTAYSYQVLTPTAATPVMSNTDGIHENAVGQQQCADGLDAIITARGL